MTFLRLSVLLSLTEVPSDTGRYRGVRLLGVRPTVVTKSNRKHLLRTISSRFAREAYERLTQRSDHARHRKREANRLRILSELLEAREVYFLPWAHVHDEVRILVLPRDAAPAVREDGQVLLLQNAPIQCRYLIRVGKLRQDPEPYSPRQLTTCVSNYLSYRHSQANNWHILYETNQLEARVLVSKVPRKRHPVLLVAQAFVFAVGGEGEGSNDLVFVGDVAFSEHLSRPNHGVAPIAQPIAFEFTQRIRSQTASVAPLKFHLCRL